MTLMDYYPPQLRSLVENKVSGLRYLEDLFKASWEAHVIRGDKTMRYGDDNLTWAPHPWLDGLTWSHCGKEVDWTVKDVHASYESEMSNLLEEMSKNIN